MKSKLRDIVRRISRILAKAIAEELVNVTAHSHAFLLEAHRDEMRRNTPSNPALFGFKVYSQNDEDGIIQYIFDTIGVQTSNFLEIGIGDGIENNTHYLGIRGWSGIWIDGSPENIARLRSDVETRRSAVDQGASGKIVVKQAFVTRSNVSELTRESCRLLGIEPDDIAFVSIDVDGNDVYLAEALLAQVKPSCVCIEYNAIFPPNLSFRIPYEESFQWDQDDHSGASLRNIAETLGALGYRLVGCNVSGVNAFFVHERHGSLFDAYDLDQLYMPFRGYHLTSPAPPHGHRRTIKNLATRVEFDFF